MSDKKFTSGEKAKIEYNADKGKRDAAKEKSATEKQNQQYKDKQKK